MNPSLSENPGKIDLDLADLILLNVLHADPTLTITNILLSEHLGVSQVRIDEHLAYISSQVDLFEIFSSSGPYYVDPNTNITRLIYATSIDRVSIKKFLENEGFARNQYKLEDYHTIDQLVGPKKKILELLALQGEFNYTDIRPLLFELFPYDNSVNRLYESGIFYGICEFLSWMKGNELIKLKDGWPKDFYFNIDTGLDSWRQVPVLAKMGSKGHEYLSTSSVDSVNKSESESEIDDSGQIQSGVKIFISHSSKDKAIADAFIDLILHGAMHIHTNEIFCSSSEGSRIRSGENWREAIRKSLKTTQITIPIITLNYQQSEMSMNELGAIWIMDGRLFPVIVAPITFETAGPIAATLQCEDLLMSQGLDHIREAIEESLKIPAGNLRLGRWTQKSAFLQKLLDYCILSMAA